MFFFLQVFSTRVALQYITDDLFLFTLFWYFVAAFQTCK